MPNHANSNKIVDNNTSSNNQQQKSQAIDDANTTTTTTQLPKGEELIEAVSASDSSNREQELTLQDYHTNVGNDETLDSEQEVQYDCQSENVNKAVNNNFTLNQTNNDNNNITTDTDNQNGNEVIEGTGVVKTLPVGKVVRRKKTPPQGGSNGIDSVTNNNRVNAMHRTSLAKMEGLANTSTDYLNVSAMSVSMEIEGKCLDSKDFRIKSKIF